MRSPLVISIIVILLSLSVNSPASWNSASTVETVEVSTINGDVMTSTKIGCEGCSGCSSPNEGFSLPFREFPFIVTAIALLALLVVKRNRLKVLFWTLGLTLFLGFALSLSEKQTGGNEPRMACNPDSLKEDLTKKEIAQAATTELSGDDEFLPVSGDDEFQAFSETDDFQPLNNTETKNPTGWFSKSEIKNLTRTLIALIAAIAAGFAIRFSRGRVLRNTFLLSSLVYLGFYSGGCPCMISSLQNLILLLLGEQTQWITLVWIIGLLPVTYFFGKIWCGWVCHLGALQEFLYHPASAKRLLSPTVQKTFKIIRLVAFIALIIQLIITRTNLFIKIDPFKVAFNLNSSNVTGYILLAILLISSLLVYRPFCRAFCPVGLILGWVNKIPGASRLQINPGCNNCSRCYVRCDYQAISTNNKSTIIDNSECIRCGNCLDFCKYDLIQEKRKR
jgi:ferredoxin